VDGLFTIATGQTFTIDVPFTAGLYQVFNCVGTGQVVFSASLRVYPQWFGAKGDDSTDDAVAMASTITSIPNGGIIDGSGLIYIINGKNLGVSVDNVFWKNITLKRTSTDKGWLLTYAVDAETNGGGLENVTLIGNPLVAASGGLSMGNDVAPYKASGYTLENVTAKTFGEYGIGINYGDNWVINNIRILQHGLTTGTVTSCMGFYVYPKHASHGGVLSNVYSELSNAARDNATCNSAAIKLQTHANLIATNITAKYGREEAMSIDSVLGSISNVYVIHQSGKPGLVVGNWSNVHSFSGQIFNLSDVKVRTVQGGTVSLYAFVIRAAVDKSYSLTGCTIRNVDAPSLFALNYTAIKDCTLENFTIGEFRLSTTYVGVLVNSSKSTGNTFRNINVIGGDDLSGVLAIEASDSVISNCGLSPVTGDTTGSILVYGDDNLITGLYAMGAASNALTVYGSNNHIFNLSLYQVTGKALWFPVGSDNNRVYSGATNAGTGITDYGTGNWWANMKGATLARPTLEATEIGFMYFDTTLDADGLPVWWNGAKWIKADGSDA
jgi:hypothetical protein